MRKTYGNTWWGKQWLNALNNIDYSNRLPRGRTYANKGRAHDIEINGNQITAKVSGSRPRPYRVDFKIPLFSASTRLRSSAWSRRTRCSSPNCSTASCRSPSKKPANK